MPVIDRICGKYYHGRTADLSFDKWWRKNMNRLFCTSALLIIVPALALAQGVTLSDHSTITVLSDFRIQEPVELRTEKDISAEVRYRTLNHEGGTDFAYLKLWNAATTACGFMSC